MEYFENLIKNMDILIFYPIFAPHPISGLYVLWAKDRRIISWVFRMRCPGFHGSNLSVAVLRKVHTFHLLWKSPHCTSWVFSIQQIRVDDDIRYLSPSYCFLIVIFKQPKFSMKISFWKWMKLSTFNILLSFCNRPDWLKEHLAGCVLFHFEHTTNRFLLSYFKIFLSQLRIKLSTKH